jgi:hypothetical protein
VQGSQKWPLLAAAQEVSWRVTLALVPHCCEGLCLSLPSCHLQRVALWQESLCLSIGTQVGQGLKSCQLIGPKLGSRLLQAAGSQRTRRLGPALPGTSDHPQMSVPTGSSHLCRFNAHDLWMQGVHMGGSPSQGQRRERARGPSRDFVRVCDLQVPLENEVCSMLALTIGHLGPGRGHLLRPLAYIAARARDH